MREAAGERTAHADRQMRDMARDPRQEYAERAAGGRRLEPNVPGKRADAERATLLAHVIQGLDAVDVDQVGRAREAKIHCRHEALPAGEDLAFLAVFGEEIERRVESAWRKVSESGRFHDRCAAPKRFPLVTLNEPPGKSSRSVSATGRSFFLSRFLSRGRDASRSSAGRCRSDGRTRPARVRRPSR